MRRDAIASLFLVLSSAPAFSQGPPLFGQPAPAFAVGGTPKQVLAGDLDRDGNPDLLGVVAGVGLSVRLGDGAGGFGAPTATDGVGASALGDFDGDGVLDVAFAAPDSTSASFRLGTGTGTFGAPVPLGGPFLLLSEVAAGDIDGDGDADVVASTFFLQAQILAWRNDAGSLVAAAGAPTNAAGTFLRLADLDEDGSQDAILITTGPAPALRTFLATGGGALALAFDLPFGLGANPAALGRGDVDGDGHCDAVVTVVTVSGPSGVEAVYKGDGVGQLSLVIPTIPMGVVLRSVDVADVDGDGVVDLVGARTFHGSGVLSALLGAGGGAFGAPIDSDVGVSPLPFALTDLDGNGHLDVLVGNTGSASVSVLQSQVADPTGISSFGTGTPGCSGTQGITATAPAAIGSQEFFVVTTGAPADSLGLLLFADAANVPGSDFFGIGVLAHLDFPTLTLLFPFDMRSDPHGYATGHVPVVADPALAGLVLFAQSWWFWESCPPSTFGLSASRGLTIVHQP